LVEGRVGRRLYLRVTNIGEKAVSIDAHTVLGYWLPADALPWSYGFVRIDSR
jgi:hypothetical protein